MFWSSNNIFDSTRLMVWYGIFIFQRQYKVISKQKIASKMLPYCQWKASAI